MCLPHTPLARREAVGIPGLQAGEDVKKEPGRHWSLGGCFVEFPGGGIEEPVDLVGVPGSIIRVLSVEAMLVQRLVSYRATGATAHGIQAALIIRAMGDRLDMARIEPLARKEGVVTHYNAVRALALASPPVPLDSPTLNTLYWTLRPGRVSAVEAVAACTPARTHAATPPPPAISESSVDLPYL